MKKKKQQQQLKSNTHAHKLSWSESESPSQSRNRQQTKTRTAYLYLYLKSVVRSLQFVLFAFDQKRSADCISCAVGSKIYAKELRLIKK